MAPTHFKFTTPEGVNRRLSFSEPPTWSLLASKLHVLCGISLDNVGVSYVDNDNDEITLSSDEELQDFYKMSHQAGQVIKFAVVDLHASQNNAGKPREFTSFNRNPFEADPFEFIGEWEGFPSVLMEDRSKSGPHAFVEVLSSNNSVAHDHTHQMDTDTDDDHSTAQPPLSNKGKGRSLSFGAASITSVLEEEMSRKHPIHVYDLNSREDDKDQDNSFDDSPAHIHVAAQSTPKVQAKNIDDNRDTKETTPPPKAVEVEDPPLPSLDESPASAATSASLIQDLASLINDAAQVVSSHPELSEGLRNIGRNINAGTYWTAHCEAFSDTVNGMSNPPSTEGRRQVDEAAVRMLTSGIGNFFRTLSQIPVGTEDTRAPDINENRSDQFHGESFAHVCPPFQGMRSLGPQAAGSRRHYMYPSHTFHGMPHGPSRQPSIPFHHAPHAVPPPPRDPASPLSTHDHPFPGLLFPQTPDPSFVQGHIPPPPPPNVPPPNGTMPGSHGPSNNRRQSYQSHVSFSPDSGDQSRSKPNAQELRAQVEAAKRIYKAEKERYRQEREQRRREKTAGKPTVRYSATYVQGFPKYFCAHQAYRVAPVAQAEIPRGNETSSIQLPSMYPEVERVSVPRRTHTHVGHGAFRREEDLTTRAIARITRKLVDVGYGLSKSSMF
jgi:hypothetical protein